MAKPMMDGAGSKVLEVEAGPASQDAHDLFRTGEVVADRRIGVDVDVGAVDEMLISGSVCVVAIS
jgi:hypothetical protein